MPTWLEDVIKGLNNIDGIGTLQEIYDAVSTLRPEPHPKSYTAIIRRTLESNSSDSEAFNKKNDLFYSVNGIGGGIWGIRTSLNSTPVAKDIDNPDLPNGNQNPNKSLTTTYRILRDTQLAIKIKKLYNNKCQICNLTIPLKNGNFYSEAHHIIPLGKHNGSDTPENIIVLCPNHHVMMDYGLIPLKINEIYIHKKHNICKKSIKYHNQIIFEKQNNL
ncbi:HNH endonuclease [Acinetobacter chinensis]|uniref:HNH endonuclease n=1 Tax=Acinetobacter chinensis TaxID=2004650 RepID=A0A3B7M5Z9_9GAMM|nr:HNH endonuclease [Acinetobacter chinensis]AXY57869.1 HNH endonuclease [Acinetobacter chinensis]